MFENVFDATKINWQNELFNEGIGHEDGTAVAYITAMVGDDCLELTIRGDGHHASTAVVKVTDTVTGFKYWLDGMDSGFDGLFVGGFDVFEQAFNDAVLDLEYFLID